MTCIVLIGPMGAGKTTLGKKLAKALELSFQDTDRLVEAKHGSISSIFDKEGEERFRDYEQEALADALRAGGVVATGGGVVLREQNLKALIGHKVIFLDTDADSVMKRVNLLKRPLLRDNPERWTEIYLQRLALYESIAGERLFTGNRPIKKLVSELRTKVETYGK